MDPIFLTAALRQIEQPTFRVSPRPVTPPAAGRESAPWPAAGSVPGTLLRTRVRRLVERHAAVERAEHLSLAPWLVLAVAAGGLVGWTGGEAVYSVQYPHHANSFPNIFKPVPFSGSAVLFGGLAGSAVLAGLVVVGRAWRTARRREAAQQLARVVQAARTDPLIPAAWGGPAAFESPEVVRRIGRMLDAGLDPAAPPAPVTPADLAADPAARSILVDRLNQLLRGRHAAAWQAGWATALFGLLLVLTVGQVFGGGAILLIDWQGSPGYRLEVAVLVGTSAAVLAVLTAFSYGWMLRARRRRDERVAELTEDLERDYGPVLRTWGGVQTLADDVGVYNAIQRLERA